MFRYVQSELAHLRARDLAEQACRLRRTARRATIRRPRRRASR
jgi:hypothetical protein